MGRAARIRLFCSVNGQHVERETDVIRHGRDQVCKCHQKQVMARCVTCGLIEYNICSAHDRKPGHTVISINDSYSAFTNTESEREFDPSIYCYTMDLTNKTNLFSKPCPFIAVRDDALLEEGDIILLVMNEKIMHVTRLMERETSKRVIQAYAEGNDMDIFYTQEPVMLDSVRHVEEVVSKWSSIKNKLKEASTVEAIKSLIPEMTKLLDQ